MRLLVLLLIVAPVHAAPSDAHAWLATQSLSGADAAIALGAAGVDPALASHLTLEIASPASPKDYLAVAMAGQRTWDGRDMVAEATDAAPAAIETPGIGDDAFIQLALRAWGVPHPGLQAALQQAQQADGGWTCWGPSSVDCTGYALAALGGGALDVPAARAFLDAHVTDGVRSDNSSVTTPNANSAAWYLHARIGTHHDDVAAWLQTLQTEEGGVAWEPGGPPNLFATLEALPWLDGQHTWPEVVAVPPIRVEGGHAETDWNGTVTWSHEGGTAHGRAVELDLGPGSHQVRVEGRNGTQLWRTTILVEGADDPVSPAVWLAIGAVLVGLAYAWKRR